VRWCACGRSSERMFAADAHGGSWPNSDPPQCQRMSLARMCFAICRGQRVRDCVLGEGFDLAQAWSDIRPGNRVAWGF
jgi:hypothetical protein